MHLSISVTPCAPRLLLLFLLDGIGSGSPQDLRGNIKHRIISEPPPSHPFPLARSPSHQHRHSFSSTAKSSESCLNPFFFPSSVSPCRQEQAQVWLIGQSSDTISALLSRTTSNINAGHRKEAELTIFAWVLR